MYLSLSTLYQKVSMGRSVCPVPVNLRVTSVKVHRQESLPLFPHRFTCAGLYLLSVVVQQGQGPFTQIFLSLQVWIAAVPFRHSGGLQHGNHTWNIQGSRVYWLHVTCYFLRCSCTLLLYVLVAMEEMWPDGNALLVYCCTSSVLDCEMMVRWPLLHSECFSCLKSALSYPGDRNLFSNFHH